MALRVRASSSYCTLYYALQCRLVAAERIEELRFPLVLAGKHDDAALILTHDVESAEGLRLSRFELADL